MALRTTKFSLEFLATLDSDEIVERLLDAKLNFWPSSRFST